MITQANKDLWIDNLTNGKYKQARTSLVIGGRYCCLGVYLHQTFGTCYSIDPDSPLNIGSYHWLKDQLDTKETDIVGDLMHLNDRKRFTFPEIAEWIKKNVNATTENNPV